MKCNLLFLFQNYCTGCGLSGFQNTKGLQKVGNQNGLKGLLKLLVESFGSSLSFEPRPEHKSLDNQLFALLSTTKESKTVCTYSIQTFFLLVKHAWEVS